MFVAAFIAGIPVRVALVLELAGLVDDEELASKLRRAVENETRVLATDDGERDELLLALVEPPEGLASCAGCSCASDESRSLTRHAPRRQR